MFHSIVITCWRTLACFALSNKTCLDLPRRLLRWYLPGRRDPRHPPVLLLAWQSEGWLFGEASVGFEKKLLGKVLFCHSMPRLQQTSLWINGPWLHESSLLTMCTFWLFKKRMLLLFYQTNDDSLPLKSSSLSLLIFFFFFCPQAKTSSSSCCHLCCWDWDAWVYSSVLNYFLISLDYMVRK